MSITREAASVASDVIERAGSMAGEAVHGAGRAAGAIVDGAGRATDEATDLAAAAPRSGIARIVFLVLALVGAVVVWRRMTGDDQQRPTSEMDRLRAA